MHRFHIENTDSSSNARAGSLQTGRGTIQTPVFMPVGTLATVKAVHQRELKEDLDAKIILGNTYHLYLRPGIEILREAGGLHGFMGWDRAILTDSGGFQIFSLSDIRKLTPEGATFRSHIDGSKHVFTPESVIDIQRIIGADIIMAFDECPPHPCTEVYAAKSLKLTNDWLDRCFARFNQTEPHYGKHQSLFPIVQGSIYPHLRVASAEYIAGLNHLEGVAIGGLSVGEPAEEMYAMVELVQNILPKDKPRYLMGVGTPINLLENITLGIDMFDCVMPARNGRNGMLFTWEGILNIKNKKWERDFSPLDAQGKVYVDSQYSKAYLRHLFASNERLAAQIATLHNLGFYLDLMRQARSHILQGDFSVWKDRQVQKLGQRL